MVVAGAVVVGKRSVNMEVVVVGRVVVEIEGVAVVGGREVVGLEVVVVVGGRVVVVGAVVVEAVVVGKRSINMVVVVIGRRVVEAIEGVEVVAC